MSSASLIGEPGSKPAVVQVLYEASAADTFKWDYYMNTHMPLVEKHWVPQGLKSWTITKVDKESGFSVQAILHFESLDKVDEALKVGGPGCNSRFETMGDYSLVTAWRTEAQGLEIGVARADMFPPGYGRHPKFQQREARAMD